MGASWGRFPSFLLGLSFIGSLVWDFGGVDLGVSCLIDSFGF